MRDSTREEWEEALRLAVGMAVPCEEGGSLCITGVCTGCNAENGESHEKDCQYVKICEITGVEPKPIPEGER